MTLVLLSFIPLYPQLILRTDKGGILGIPHFAENYTRKGSLFTWPFNEYAVTAPINDSRVFQVDVHIGDYILLLLADAQGNKAGVRASVEPQILSGAIHLQGDKLADLKPLPEMALARRSVHRLRGEYDGALLHVSVDGRPAFEAPFPGRAEQWTLISGLKSSEIINYEIGPRPGAVRILHPWSYKTILLSILMILIIAYLVLAGRNLGQTSRWIWSLVFLALAGLLIRPSLLMILAFLSVILGAVISEAFGWTALLIARLRKREIKAGTLTIKFIRTVLLVVMAASLLILQLMVHRQAPADLRIQEPRQICPAQSAANTTPARIKRIMIYGSSTAQGEGLAHPDTESFGGLLRRQLGAGAVVDIKAKAGAALNGILQIQEREKTAADLVILYSTFNDAMYANGSLLDSLLAGRVFDLYKYSYDASDFMRANYARYRDKYESRLRAFVQRARASGAQVLLVGELCADQVLYARRDHGIYLYYQAAKTAAEQAGGMFLDASEDFFAHRDDILFIDAMHLNARGHCLLADSIYPIINRLLPGDGTAP